MAGAEQGAVADVAVAAARPRMVDLDAREAGQVDLGVAGFDDAARGGAADVGGQAQRRALQNAAHAGRGEERRSFLGGVDQYSPFDRVARRELQHARQ